MTLRLSPLLSRLLPLLLVAVTARATAAVPDVRPATPEDLIGFWEQVDIRGSGERELDGLYYSGNQFWEFFPDGFARVLVFSDDVPDQEQVTTIRERGPKRTRWEPFDEIEGMVQLVYPNGSTYYVMATYYLETIDYPRSAPRGERLPEMPREGDITLTYLDLETMRPIYFRLLRYRGEVIEPIPEALRPEPVPVEEDPVLGRILEDLRRSTDPVEPPR